MQLKEFSSITPVIAAAEVFKALETVINPSIIEQTLLETDSLEERQRFPAISTRRLARLLL